MTGDNKAVVTVTRQAEDFLIVEGNHGGYLEGKCFACNQYGWLMHLRSDPSKHKPECEVAAVLFAKKTD